MTFLQAVLLGIIQGLTEFFPVSSSAHLKLARWFLGAPDDVIFDLVCHSGTLLALVWFLRKDVWEVLCSVRKMAFFTLALIPLVPGYFLLKPVREALSEPAFLGFALMGTGAILFAATKKKDVIEKKKWHHVLCIGMMQTMALIPGISRSGSTIAAARFCGWNWREAAKFSFLLAIPTILGGEALEWLKGSAASPVDWGCYVGGFAASFGLGSVGVRFIFWVYEQENLKPFAWYCIGLGLFAWAMFHG
ncbi:MAG: undecaprenyl-diphosphate phosphatase [Verrucomicrobia bacterium]|nr:undecaprenyl-diphosphate phosphatase [Verrucomicrobiota bacterium]MBU6446869.1 undecaprenyl-diphosphate phosphatase [Verrucomicrobiota bacterium]MDE3047899.1 undecaprenyl-diphosphate phosphatase [Verrucomicrobiota bacterium]